MRFRTRQRGAHVANTGISRRAAEARICGLLPLPEFAEAAGTSQAAIRRAWPPDERHHEQRGDRVVLVEYYAASDLDDPDFQAALDSDRARLAARRRDRRGRGPRLPRGSYPVRRDSAGRELWRHPDGRLLAVTRGDPRRGAYDTCEPGVTR